MNHPELAKQIDRDLYPEVAQAGNLSNALNYSLAHIGSPLRADAEIKFIPFARVGSETRFCQMYIAMHERLFILDFWSEGVTYGKGSCADLIKAAHAINFWIIEKPDILMMESRFSFFVAYEHGKAHEAGNAVEYQWRSLHDRWRKTETSMTHLIEAAGRRPELRQLFPITSHNSLHFSRTTGFPFTDDCPFAQLLDGERFRVYAAYRNILNKDFVPGTVPTVIGEGGVQDAISMLVANLPPNCGPAVNGTAEDFSQ